MIRINLLPYEDRPRPRSLPLPDRVSLVIYAFALLMLAAGVYSFLQQGSKLRGLENKRVELAQEEERLARQTKAIERLELQTALLNDRLGILRQVETHRFDNIEWLNALNGVLPDKLWLQELARNQGGNKTTLKGVAEGYRPVSRLMQSMEDSGSFASVQLVSAERGPRGGRAVINFTISADWGEAAPAPVEETAEQGVPRRKTGGKS